MHGLPEHEVRLPARAGREGDPAPVAGRTVGQLPGADGALSRAARQAGSRTCLRLGKGDRRRAKTYEQRRSCCQQTRNGTSGDGGKQFAEQRAIDDSKDVANARISGNDTAVIVRRFSGR